MSWPRGVKMSTVELDDDRLINQLRRTLPALAYGRPTLQSFFKNRLPPTRGGYKLRIVGVFKAPHGSIMCQVCVDGSDEENVFVAPIEQVSLSRKHPLARALDCGRLRVRRAQPR